MRLPLCLILLCGTSFLTSCDEDDECSTSAVGLCPRETIVGNWAGTETITAYRSGEVVEVLNYPRELEFRADGTLRLPNFVGDIIDEWYWLPESAKLLTLRLPLSDTTGGVVRNTNFNRTSKYDVTACSASELAFENREELPFVDTVDYYLHEYRLEKRP